MKAFVTGGSGFIGSRVVAKLVACGYDVHALARSEASAARLRAAGAQPVQGDITDIDSMRAGMKGSQVVFHIAAWYKLGRDDWRMAETINVTGTRNVLSLACELGIPKIIYTSTIAVWGDTHGGQVCDENTPIPSGPFLTEYDRTKWMAHTQVALPFIEKGAPLVIVMPGAVYGPGDPSLVGQILQAYLRGWMPALPGPELTLAWSHVDDIAEGHILAAERGQPGQSYFLTGPVYSMGEMVPIWARLAGRKEPALSVPARLLRPFAPIMDALSSFVPLPEILSHDAIVILGADYRACPDKAIEQLGWRPRPLEIGMRQTIEATLQEIHRPAASQPQDQRATRLAVAALLGLGLLWLTRRRRKG